MGLEVSGDNATDGARLIDSVWKSAEDIINNNPSDLGFDVVALGLDALGFVANPLNNLVGAGVGWLIEHLSFLKEPLDDLAGDPAAVNVVAATWGEVASACAAAGDQYAQMATTQTASWKGESGDAYRAAAAQVAEQIKAMEGAANAMSTGIRGTGVAVATVRGIIRDLIADVVAEIIIAAVAALATSWASFGSSIAAFIGWAVARGASTAATIASRIGKLLMTLAQTIRRFDNLRDASNALARASVAIGNRASSVGRDIRRHGAAVRQIEDAISGANSAVRGGVTFGNNAVQEAARRIDDFLSPRGRDGFADTIRPAPLGRTGAIEGIKEGGNWDESYEQGQEEARRQA